MKINPWAFGGLFLLISGIWMWNNFELPKFYPFERVGKVEAIVFQSKLVVPRLPGFGAGGFDQIVNFVYEIDEVIYISKYRAHKTGQFQITGDSLLVTYSKNDPQRTDPIIYYHNVSSKKRWANFSKSFLHTKPNGYKALDLKENIFTYEDYAQYGERLIKTTGTYIIEDNIIKLSPLIYYQNRKVGDSLIEEPKPINTDEEKIFLSNFIINPNGSIIEVNTNLIFDITGKK
ncbi:hypothetical protein [Aquimarina sp. 2201CG14-23]|uniref:hypothetical protein n=1 Tax=Aquimarina mycalae TaxID=3040073 RepID=UPI002478095D|nr:hypothetical protein [Aquimarina sp. 2201CG14-23]MDH7446997.1 hypothetical protein [Aquimarina sp. 2201CG14-23]